MNKVICHILKQNWLKANNVELAESHLMSTLESTLAAINCVKSVGDYRLGLLLTTATH